MRAIIIDNRTIYLDNITPDVDDLLYEYFSAKDPRAKYINSVQEQSWDGVYRKYRKGSQKLSKAYLRELLNVCHKYNIPITIKDIRQPSKYPMFKPEDIRPDLLHGITLTDYQMKGLLACTKKINDIYINEIGIMYYVTGAGKCLTHESTIIVNEKEIEIGTLFDGFSEEETKSVHNLYVYGPNGYQEINKLYKTNKRKIIKITLEDTYIRGVYEHKIFTSEGWKQLKDIKIGDMVYVKNNGHICKNHSSFMSNKSKQLQLFGFIVRDNWQQVTKVEVDQSYENCYDLQINDISHAFWSNNILSHNTELMCGIIKLLNCPTVIIAEETVVVDQIKKRLELRKVVDEAGVFYAGKLPSDQLVCVGSLASLITPPKLYRPPNIDIDKWHIMLKAYKTRLKHHDIYKKMLKKCELLIIDECDKASTNKQYKSVIQRYTNSRYIYGFTGTLPSEKEKLNKLNLTELMGNVIAQSDRKYLESMGRIIPIKYIMIVSGENDNRNDKTAFDIAVKEFIEQNHLLHLKIKQIVDTFTDDNFLILVENIQLGNTLQAILPDSTFICGQTNRNTRNQVLQSFESRKLRVLIGSKILKRGLDIKGGIDNLIICASNQKYSDLEQKIGRAMRLNKRGWARVFDFLFIDNFYLYKHSRCRLKRMVELGYKTTVCTKHGVLDGKDVIRKGFRLSKYL